MDCAQLCSIANECELVGEGGLWSSPEQCELACDVMRRTDPEGFSCVVRHIGSCDLSACGAGEGEGEGDRDCVDEDGDGYGRGDDCRGWDCDDGDRNVHPGVAEDCDNEVDDDCDEMRDGLDPDCREEEECVDRDRDGYGEGAACEGEDCDDDDRNVHEGARERCDDGVDNDCDGQTDEGCGGGDGLGCGDILTCAWGCPQGDAACQQDCIAQASPAGEEVFNAYQGCVQRNCPQGSSDSCPYDRCPDELRACMLDSEEPLTCGALNTCTGTCGRDEVCRDGCRDAASAVARNQFDALYACVGANCQQAEDVNACADRECAGELEDCFGARP